MRMFDDGYLTPTVAEFLREERELLSAIVDCTGSEIGHIIEAGCGYGRLADTARACAVKYDGLDIVHSWIAERSLDLHEDARVHRGAIEYLPELSSRFVCRPSHRSLVILPFNLVGNLVNPALTIERLRKVGVALLIVSFGPEKAVTGRRLEYYRACGFTSLRVEVTDRGTRIVGRECLDSTAYSSDFLKSIARERGYSVAQQLSLTSGFALLLRPHHTRASFITSSCRLENGVSLQL